MAAFSSDELKYMKAIADYRAKKISYSEFLDKTIKLRDIRRHIKDSHYFFFFLYFFFLAFTNFFLPLTSCDFILALDMVIRLYNLID